MAPEPQPQLERKTYDVADLKVTGPSDSGRFEAIVSVFGNVDEGGDRMVKGAFERTLKAPKDGGRGFPPIVWSHLWGVVPIGASMRAEEVSAVDTPRGKIDGLFVEGELLVDEHQTAKEVYAAMRQKGGDGLSPLREFSFGYRPMKTVAYDDQAPEVEENPGLLRDLLDVDLFEVGPTLVGMNPRTELLGVKGAELRSVFTGKQIAELLGLDAIATDLREALLASLPDVGKGVLPHKDTPAMAEDTGWDSAAETARADVADLRAMCAWYDSSAPDSKASYKLPHHRADASHPVVWRAVRGAMGALLAGRVEIPDAHRAGVYAHLAKHYRQFDKEPPALDGLGDAELKTMFPEHYPPSRKAVNELLLSFR